MPAKLKNIIEIMAKISFVKMHGLGNDFVMINADTIPAEILNSDFTKKILHRRLGIGGDQLIIYSIDQDITKSKNIKMDIYNSDGSSASACGNASRCLVKLMHDQYGINEFDLHVDNRNLHCSIVENNKYTVNMGMASTSAKWIPSDTILLELASKYNLGPKELICIDVGNPHLVIFSKLYRKDMEIIGRELQNSEIFPDGINVNFPIINNNKIDLVVYERGTGFTLACGSGACATFAGAYNLGRISVETNQSVLVEFKLGSLEMRMNNNHVLMSGPAEYIFSGDYMHD